MSFSSSPSSSEIVDRREMSAFQIRTIVICGLVIVLDGFDTQSIGFLVPYISKSLAIPVNAFGPVLAAGLIGLMVGAMTTGPIADAWGRRWTVIVSVLLFGIFAFVTAQAQTFSELVACRFLTGLGLGGAFPNAVALGGEYTPKRILRVSVALITAGMPAGAFLVSVAGSFLIPLGGWQAVFYLGGAIPLLLALVLIWQLPESLRFLLLKKRKPERIARLVARIAPEFASVPLAPETRRQEKGGAVLRLFRHGRAGTTLLLWLLFFANLLTIYFIISWLPALLVQSGMSPANGVVAIAVFSIAGVIGTVMEAPLINRSGAHLVLLAEFVLAVVLVASLAASAGSFWPTMAIVAALGVSIQGLQAGLMSLAADFYPTAIRSTGLGWALGTGRFGSIVGPLAAGVLLTMMWTPQQIFLAGSVPAGCAALALIVYFLRPRSAAAEPVPET